MEVLAIPPAMKSVVPVTAALRAKSERAVSLLVAMMGMNSVRKQLCCAMCLFDSELGGDVELSR